MVHIDFIGRCASSKDDFGGKIFQEVENWTIVIGERDVVNAVEMGVRFMKHSHAVVYSHSKFALGPGTRVHGDYELPPDSNVIYEITIRRIVENVDDIALLEICQSKKAIANDIVRHERIQTHEFAKQRALQLYKRAIAMLESSLQKPNDDYQSVTECLLDCRNNIAAVYLTCKQYHDAKEACIEVLKLDSKNGKALLRAAKACIYDPSSTFLEAKATIQAAEKMCGENEDLAKEIRKLKDDLSKRQAKHKRQKQLMVSRMAKGTMSSEPTEVSPKAVATTEIGSEEKKRKNMFLVVVFLGIAISVLIPVIISFLGFETKG